MTGLLLDPGSCSEDTLPHWFCSFREVRRRRHLFLGGGGYKTLGFLGALQTLGWYSFKSISGVSAGAILALHLTLGYTMPEICTSMSEHELWLFDVVSLGRMRYGRAPICRDDLREMAEKLLTCRGLPSRTTLRQLSQWRGVCFGAVAFCLDTCQLEYFEASTHPDICVADAVAASMAIPLIVSPVEIEVKGVMREYCDAGLVTSAPLAFFDAADTVALIVRLSDASPSVSFPETLFFRSFFLMRMSLERATQRGMIVLQVPYPTPGVGVLMRHNTPVSTCMQVGALYAALYVAKAEIAGAWVVMLSGPLGQ